MKPSVTRVGGAPTSAPDGAPPVASRRSRWLNVLGGALFIGALVYLVTTLRVDAAGLVRSAAAVGWLPVAAAIALGIPTLLFQAGYHALLLERLSGVRGQRGAVVAAYLQGQVVRYLPGKVWGMLFQSQRLSGTHAPRYVVVANLWQTVMSALLSAGVVASVIAGVWIHPGWLLGLLPALVLVEWMHRRPFVEGLILRLLARWLPGTASVEGVPAVPRLPWRGTALLVAEWLTYLAGFCVMLQGVAGVAQSALLGVWYAGASLLALAAVAVPAGIAVREAIFLAVPDTVGLDAATLLTTAVLARVVQVVAELVAAVAAGVVMRGRHGV